MPGNRLAPAQCRELENYKLYICVCACLTLARPRLDLISPRECDFLSQEFAFVVPSSSQLFVVQIRAGLALANTLRISLGDVGLNQ